MSAAAADAQDVRTLATTARWLERKARDGMPVQVSSQLALLLAEICRDRAHAIVLRRSERHGSARHGGNVPGGAADLLFAPPDPAE